MSEYCDIIGKPLDVPESFRKNGAEGRRVGYFCPSCKGCYPIKTKELRWNNAGVASDGICPCGSSVLGIYERVSNE